MPPGLLPPFHGQIPADLATGYRHQEAAIRAFPGRDRGLEDRPRRTSNSKTGSGAPALAGPIFAKAVRRANGREPVTFPVFTGGFAAIEAEFVLRARP